MLLGQLCFIEEKTYLEKGKHVLSSQQATGLMLQSGLLMLSVLSGPLETISQESVNGTLKVIQVASAISSIKEGKGQSSWGVSLGVAL